MTQQQPPKDPAQEILEGAGKLLKALIKGGSRKKRPSPGFTGINPPPPKPGCGGCGR